MHQNPSVGWATPGPAGELKRSFRPPSRSYGLGPPGKGIGREGDAEERGKEGERQREKGKGGCGKQRRRERSKRKNGKKERGMEGKGVDRNEKSHFRACFRLVPKLTTLDELERTALCKTCIF